MSSLALSQDLLGLVPGTEHRSKMARFREIFDQVCAALDAGVRHLAIRDVLAKHGLDLTAATLDVMISRVRRERNRPPPHDARRAPVQRMASVPENDEQSASLPSTDAHAAAPAGRTTRQRVGEAIQSLREMAAAAVRPKVALPDDWLSGKLTPEQVRSLTQEQRAACHKARVEMYFPNPLRGWSPPVSTQAEVRGIETPISPKRKTARYDLTVLAGRVDTRTVG